MTIDVQLSELGHGLLGGGQLAGINPSEVTLGLGGSNAAHHSDAPEEPLLISSSPVGSLQDEDMDDFKVTRSACNLGCTDIDTGIGPISF